MRFSISINRERILILALAVVFLELLVFAAGFFTGVLVADQPGAPNAAPATTLTAPAPAPAGSTTGSTTGSGSNSNPGPKDNEPPNKTGAASGAPVCALLNRPLIQLIQPGQQAFCFERFVNRKPVFRLS